MPLTDRIPLALLPGLLTDRALWAYQIEALGDLAESRVADFTSQDSVAGMARSVLAMMPERFALAGLSRGSMALRPRCAACPMPRIAPRRAPNREGQPAP